MSQVKTELWSQIVGQFVECQVGKSSSNSAGELSDYLVVYALELGADVRTVDLRSVTETADALMILAKRLDFPDYFGQNLDALYDITGEYADTFQARLDARDGSVPQVWLIHSNLAQEKILFPVQDTLRDAMSYISTGVGLSIVWVVNSDQS